MKIISKAALPNGMNTRMNTRVRLTCPVCGSLLEEYKRELKAVIIHNELSYGFICPVCWATVAVRESDLGAVR